MLCFSVCCLVSLLFLSAVDSGKTLRKIKEQLQKNKQLKFMSEEQPLQQVEESWLEQPLDHFNRLKVKTFSQKFFVNEAHWDRPDGPVFLFIGGEGPIFKFDVLAGHHVEMAQQHRALLLAVEHRFYGDSINPDATMEEMSHTHTECFTSMVRL
uniref:Serine protease 16 n=1 Tax=Oryzias melastigma TaxID=30732 RepID=A0A3B3DT65_ORYME